MSSLSADVVIVGAGNAALCAAVSARKAGAHVIVLERAPQKQRGGNSFFSGGWMRFTFESAEEIGETIHELALDGKADFDVVPYTKSMFFDEMAQITQFRGDPDLISVMVNKSRETINWMHQLGVRFNWTFGKQTPKNNGRFQISGGNIAVSGGGAGLTDKLFEIAEAEGVQFLYESRAIKLLGDAGKNVTGIEFINSKGKPEQITTKSVVLASGGFGASSEKRARYLGPSWDLAKLRGSSFNTGDGIDMALEFGGQSYGHWSGAHTVCWDATSPRSGDRNSGNEFSRNSYPLGILVNKLAERFLDEAIDYSSATYGLYGSNVIAQPDSSAFQIFDSKVLDLLDPNYNGRQVSKVVANTIEELATKLGLDTQALKNTLEQFNLAVDDSVSFDPNKLDGKSTSQLTPKKSNWANKIDTAPFYGFPVTAGLTFTFGGVRVNTEAQVLDAAEQPINGLYAAGEMVGGVFYYTSPSGGGLTAGSVFGKIAGENAARR
jgi:tricarballylate dehydrogenase